MKTNLKKLSSGALVGLAVVAMVSGCSLKKSNDALTSGELQYNASDPNADIPGVGSASAPTQDAVVGRLLVGLQGSGVASTAGNFNTVLNQLGSNLPQVTDPIKAVGWDQIPLLTYAACSDVSTANIQAVYGVNTGQSITSQRSALIAAGQKIADQFTGGLASTGPYAAQAATIFGQLVDADSTVTGNTTRITFISVCMAANVFGVGMRGF